MTWLLKFQKSIIFGINLFCKSDIRGHWKLKITHMHQVLQVLAAARGMTKNQQTANPIQ